MLLKDVFYFNLVFIMSDSLPALSLYSLLSILQEMEDQRC